MNSALKLSAYEKWIYYMTLFGDENVIGVCIVESINDDIIDIHNNDLLTTALKYMTKRHPLLRACIRKNDLGDLNYEINDLIDDQLVYEYSQVSNRQELIEKMEEFNMRLFEYSKNCLLWRLKLVKFKDDEDTNREKYSLILILPMFMTDGINISTLLVEFVNIINCLITQQTCKEMNETLDLLENVHTILDKQEFKIDISNLERQRESELHVNFNFPLKFKNLNEKGLKINLAKLTQEETSILVQKCKLNKQKLTGVLIQSCYKAFKRLYEENGFKMQKDFACFVPANMRFRTKPMLNFSSIRICVLLTKLNLIYPQLLVDDTWKSIDYINESLARETSVETSSLFKFSHDLNALKEIDELFSSDKDLNELAEILNREQSCDFVLSNTGTYVFDGIERVEKPFKISETYYGDSLVSIPNEFAPLMLHTSTWNKCLMIQLSSNRRIFSSHLAIKFIELLKKELNEI